ncbi:MAG TPA: hypothetical protein VJJ47_00095 [Candidatus Paceibacterota bacterium]
MQKLSIVLARRGAPAAQFSRGRLAREAVAEAVMGTTGVAVAAADVEIKDGEVRLAVSGARRAAIFLRQREAAAAIAAALGTLPPQVR